VIKGIMKTKLLRIYKIVKPIMIHRKQVFTSKRKAIWPFPMKRATAWSNSRLTTLLHPNLQFLTLNSQGARSKTKIINRPYNRPNYKSLCYSNWHHMTTSFVSWCMESYTQLGQSQYIDAIKWLPELTRSIAHFH